jgi:hypothetical protein
VKIHRTMLEDVFLLLLDAVVAKQVYDDGRASHRPCFSLQFKKWTRFSHAEGTSLPSLVDVEIRGILTHT